MSQEYYDPKRADDPYSLPDLEVFGPETLAHCYCGEFCGSKDADTVEACIHGCKEPLEYRTGYWYWTCTPGCMPDSDPVGPFESYEEALQDAQDGYADDFPDEED